MTDRLAETAVGAAPASAAMAPASGVAEPPVLVLGAPPTPLDEAAPLMRTRDARVVGAPRLNYCCCFFQTFVTAGPPRRDGTGLGS